MKYTQTVTNEALTFDQLAVLMKTQYDNRYIQECMQEWGGMQYFTTFSPNWKKGVGNEYVFHYEDRATLDEVEIVEFVTDAVDDNGCPIQEFGDCPVRICTPDSWKKCVLKLTHILQIGIEWCYVTNDIFTPDMHAKSYQKKLKKQKEMLHYALWLALMDEAVNNPIDPLVADTAPYGGFTNHYWQTTDPIYDALLCVVYYYKRVCASEWSEFTIFLPSVVEKKLLTDERFNDCCVAISGDYRARFFNQIQLSDVGMGSVYENFFGMNMVVLQEGIDAPGGNPFEAKGAARILVAHPDAFAWHSEVLANADTVKDTTSYKMKMNTLVIAGCKVLRRDFLFVLEVTC